MAAILIALSLAASAPPTDDAVTALGLRPALPPGMALKPEIGLDARAPPAPRRRRSPPPVQIDPTPLARAPDHDAPAAPAPWRPPESRLLELWVNGRSRDVIAQVREQGGVLMVDRKAAEAAGLTVAMAMANPADFVPVAALGA